MLQLIEGLPRIPQRGEFEPEDEQDHLGLADRTHLHLAVGMVDVNDHVGEHHPCQVQNLIDTLRRDMGDVRHRPRGSQKVDTARVPDERALEKDPIHTRDVLGEIGKSVDGSQVQQRGQITRFQFQVDEGDFLVLLGQRGRHVGRQRARPAAAARGQHSNDPPGRLAVGIALPSVA